MGFGSNKRIMEARSLLLKGKPATSLFQETKVDEKEFVSNHNNIWSKSHHLDIRSLVASGGLSTLWYPY